MGEGNRFKELQDGMRTWPILLKGEGSSREGGSQVQIQGEAKGNGEVGKEASREGGNQVHGVASEGEDVADPPEGEVGEKSSHGHQV